MRPRALCHFVFALVFAPLFATAAAAQTSATIAGTIDDPNRSVLPGVTVTVRNVATSLSRTVATNGEGRYVIAGLPPGAYELRAELTSFKPHVRRDLQLTIAQALVVNITLEVGGLSEEVTVAGDTSLVNTSSAELSFLVGSEAIDQLPLNGRNYTDLALLQPGVLAYPHRDGGSVVAHGLGDERERPGSALERLPARRHAAERLHQRPGRQRRRDGARHRNGARVPGRDRTPTAPSSDATRAVRSTC